MSFFEKFLKHRAYLTLFLGTFIFLFVWIISVGPNVFYLFNKNFHSFFIETFDNTKISDDIVIVEIDDKSTTQIERFPFDRKKYIPVIERLNEQGAAVIAFDIIFADKTNPESDTAFAQAIKKAKNVIIGMSFSQNAGLEQPLSVLKKHIVATGFFSPRIDPVTKSVHSYFPFYKDARSQKVYEYFSIAVAKQYFGIKTPSYIQGNNYYLDEEKQISLPFERIGSPHIYINYPIVQDYNTISFYDIYNENEFERVKKQINLEGKIVLIGATAKGIKDTFLTSRGIQYGVYIHANVLNTIMQGAGFQFLSEFFEWIILFLIIIISIYFNLSRSGIVLFFSNISLFALSGILFPVLLYVYGNLIINYFFELVFALFLSLAISNIFKYMIENKHKNKLNQALGEYVSKDIASEILSGAGKININGEKKNISILFSDIEGFTSISEKFSPEDLVKFLRKYLSEMSHVIMDLRGFINKYEGDAIMALWGVFGKVGPSAYDACESALRQQELLTILNKKWKEEGMDEIKARIGVHMGDAIIGNIGAEGRKMEFTALGDNVNLASRLEGVNKFYGTYLCVSETVVHETRDNFSYRYLDKIRVKGKEKPVIIYELLSRKGCLEKEKKEVIIEFTKGISLYLKKDFVGAKKIFETCRRSGDKPSETYIQRCELFINEGIPNNWDGVWNHDSK
ncbi:MAG: adenylate/guanylate cyclase domain-containing protein [Candidatus Gracilibacteria bacterium]|nr:adenylate/guanylate cyclase domain-containing protein [Candidatus Gracilibacteria bacterium]